ncbi:ras suppressor protein 1 [Parasteatoda tepidariorum]|uniref:ras suppressor protein 1 n=1 Tax=Parasteatoda tepidariorum TaxID=114398 RepID=UPI00077F897A|nr:ras suppressor protein 1 [Parasteatoda tepidariorum]
MAGEKAIENNSTSCNIFDFNKMSKVKKVLDDAREQNNPEIDLVDKGITSFEELHALLGLQNITRLTLSHNKIKAVSPLISSLPNLESLNLFNNHIEEVPATISSLSKLKLLNLGMNRLSTLPRGFGSFPQLEVLDLTYNNLSEKTLPTNFFMIETLRALYLCDNDIEYLPPEIGQLKNLQILGLRENDLLSLPKEIGELSRLRELHIQGNRLSFLPPELGNLDLLGQHCVVRMDNNPWVPPIADQLQLGITHVIEYIRTDTYKYLYSRQKPALSPPPKRNDKSKKISLKKD